MTQATYIKDTTYSDAGPTLNPVANFILPSQIVVPSTTIQQFCVKVPANSGDYTLTVNPISGAYYDLAYTQSRDAFQAWVQTASTTNVDITNSNTIQQRTFVGTNSSQYIWIGIKHTTTGNLQTYTISNSGNYVSPESLLRSTGSVPEIKYGTFTNPYVVNQNASYAQYNVHDGSCEVGSLYFTFNVNSYTNYILAAIPTNNQSFGIAISSIKQDLQNWITNNGSGSLTDGNVYYNNVGDVSTLPISANIFVNSFKTMYAVYFDPANINGSSCFSTKSMSIKLAAESPTTSVAGTYGNPYNLSSTSSYSMGGGDCPHGVSYYHGLGCTGTTSISAYPENGQAIGIIAADDLNWQGIPQFLSTGNSGGYTITNASKTDGSPVVINIYPNNDINYYVAIYDPNNPWISSCSSSNRFHIKLAQSCVPNTGNGTLQHPFNFYVDSPSIFVNGSPSCLSNLAYGQFNIYCADILPSVITIRSNTASTKIIKAATSQYSIQSFFSNLATDFAGTLASDTFNPHMFFTTSDITYDYVGDSTNSMVYFGVAVLNGPVNNPTSYTPNYSGDCGTNYTLKLTQDSTYCNQIDNGWNQSTAINVTLGTFNAYLPNTKKYIYKNYQLTGLCENNVTISTNGFYQGTYNSFLSVVDLNSVDWYTQNITFFSKNSDGNNNRVHGSFDNPTDYLNSNYTTAGNVILTNNVNNFWFDSNSTGTITDVNSLPGYGNGGVFANPSDEPNSNYTYNLMTFTNTGTNTWDGPTTFYTDVSLLPDYIDFWAYAQNLGITNNTVHDTGNTGGVLITDSTRNWSDPSSLSIIVGAEDSLKPPYYSSSFSVGQNFNLNTSQDTPCNGTFSEPIIRNINNGLQYDIENTGDCYNGWTAYAIQPCIGTDVTIDIDALNGQYDKGIIWSTDLNAIRNWLTGGQTAALPNGGFSASAITVGSTGTVTITNVLATTYYVVLYNYSNTQAAQVCGNSGSTGIGFVQECKYYQPPGGSDVSGTTRYNYDPYNASSFVKQGIALASGDPGSNITSKLVYSPTLQINGSNTYKNTLSCTQIDATMYVNNTTGYTSKVSTLTLYSTDIDVIFKNNICYMKPKIGKEMVFTGNFYTGVIQVTFTTNIGSITRNQVVNQGDVFTGGRNQYVYVIDNVASNLNIIVPVASDTVHTLTTTNTGVSNSSTWIKPNTFNLSVISPTISAGSVINMNFNNANKTESFVAKIALKDLSSPSYYTLSGNITLDSVPLSGAIVSYSGNDISNSVMTNGSGNYTISNLTRGKYNLIPSFSNRSAFTPLTTNVIVQGNTTGVNFAGTSSVDISGSAKDSTTKLGIPYAIIRWGYAGNSYIGDPTLWYQYIAMNPYYTTADSQGNFIIKNVKKGFYIVAMSPPQGFTCGQGEYQSTSDCVYANQNINITKYLNKSAYYTLDSVVRMSFVTIDSLGRGSWYGQRSYGNGIMVGYSILPIDIYGTYGLYEENWYSYPLTPAYSPKFLKGTGYMGINGNYVCSTSMGGHSLYQTKYFYNVDLTGLTYIP